MGHRRRSASREENLSKSRNALRREVPPVDVNLIIARVVCVEEHRSVSVIDAEVIAQCDQCFSSHADNQISPAKMTRQATPTATAPKWLVRFSAIPTSAALMNPPTNMRITASATNGTRDL
jgi:hypothetical protein